MARLESFEAAEILRRCKINPFVDYHTLSSAQVESLLHAADHRKYRKPKNANGSRARSFHAYLLRALKSES